MSGHEYESATVEIFQPFIIVDQEGEYRHKCRKLYLHIHQRRQGAGVVQTEVLDFDSKIHGKINLH